MWAGVVLVVCAVALLVVNQWILQHIWRRWYAQHSLATEVVLVTGAGTQANQLPLDARTTAVPTNFNLSLTLAVVWYGRTKQGLALVVTLPMKQLLVVLQLLF